MEMPAEATVVIHTITLACPLYDLDMPQRGSSNMREWQVATLTAGSTMLTEAEITDLRESLRGELIRLPAWAMPLTGWPRMRPPVGTATPGTT